jgi:hypothetical protein
MYQHIIPLRSKLLVLLTHRLALPLLKIIRRPENFPPTRKTLAGLPEGTLGRDLLLLLDKNKLPLLVHYAKHDMKHILLGYPTTDEGEVCLQAFMLGNGHLSFPVISTLLFGLFTMPEHWSAFRRAYRRGKKAMPISGWNWPALVREQTIMLQQNIFIHDSTTKNKFAAK